MNSNVVNRIVMTVLRSPLHPVLSARYLVLEFTGRKTGRRYRLPVAYTRTGDDVLLSTDSRWRHNLSGRVPVRIWLGVRRVAGEATLLVDPAESVAAVRRLVDAIPSYARPAGLAREEDGRVSDSEIARAVAAGRTGIRVSGIGRPSAQYHSRLVHNTTSRK